MLDAGAAEPAAPILLELPDLGALDFGFADDFVAVIGCVELESPQATLANMTADRSKRDSRDFMTALPGRARNVKLGARARRNSASLLAVLQVSNKVPHP